MINEIRCRNKPNLHTSKLLHAEEFSIHQYGTIFYFFSMYYIRWHQDRACSALRSLCYAPLRTQVSREASERAHARRQARGARARWCPYLQISTTVDTPCLEPLRAASKDKNLMSYSPLGEACCNCDLRASVDSLRATTSTNMTPPLHTGEDVYAISTASSSRSSLCPPAVSSC